MAFIDDNAWESWGFPGTPARLCRVRNMAQDTCVQRLKEKTMTAAILGLAVLVTTALAALAGARQSQPQPVKVRVEEPRRRVR